MEQRFYDALQDCPIIAAVRDEAGLDACLASDVRMVFTLFGDVCSIPTIVDRIRAANKFAVVHLDRVTGLASKEVAVDFIQQPRVVFFEQPFWGNDVLLQQHIERQVQLLLAKKIAVVVLIVGIYDAFPLAERTLIYKNGHLLTQ